MHAPRPSRLLPALLPLLLALVVITPLLAHGCSCGHDFEFHLQSWLDAAAQMRHGTLDPAWTLSAAWNAGEPRFLFYPPLSWMLGAGLALVLPFSATPVAFTGLCLLGSALTMFRLARAFASTPAALIASAVYIASPYMLFTAFERTAYGELLAAAWIPLLLLAALQPLPRIASLGIPLALLWLSNAPAAVIGMYTVLVIALVRFALALHDHDRLLATGLLSRFAAGGALGLALPAFYLLPAATERRFVQVAMAIIPNMRAQDNFLFGHTGDGPHDQVLHTASLIAVLMLAATVAALLLAWRTNKSTQPHPLSPNTQLPTLILLTALIAFLLTPLSLPLWLETPELAFLQFPWRMLSILGAILALAIALSLRALPRSTTVLTLTTLAAIAFAAAMTTIDIHDFRQPCEALDLPSVRAQLFNTHHGVEPTDEYTPTDADNDVLRWDDPSFWLSADPAAFAPHTIPNPAATIVNYDTPPPIGQTLSGAAPRHVALTLAAPEFLILNLRDYPDWQVLRNGRVLTQRAQRDDGLLAVPLPAGDSTLDIRWHRGWDQLTGDALSLLALLALAFALLRSRTIKPDA